MPHVLWSITQLYEDHIDKLKLSWVAAVGVERLVELKDMEIMALDVVAPNLIYSHRVQVIGKAEQRWLEQVGEERWRRQIDDLMAANPPALIVADGLASARRSGDLRGNANAPIHKPEGLFGRY